MVNNIIKLIKKLSSTFGTLAALWLLSVHLNVSTNYFILIALSFSTVRILNSKFALHYKTWYRCFLWTILTFLTLFVLAEVDIWVSISLSAFAGLVTTNKCNISDMFMWKGKDSKYADIIEFVHDNPLDDRLLNFEEKIKNQNNMSYMIYKYRFKDSLTYQQIIDKLDIESDRISREIDKIAYYIRITCNI